MWWEVVVWLVVIFALLAFTVFLNAVSPRCPACKRINVFHRTKSGSRQVVYDDGVVRRISTEYVCCRCGSRYWFVWDDFDGRWLSRSSPPDTND